MKRLAFALLPLVGFLTRVSADVPGVKEPAGPGTGLSIASVFQAGWRPQKDGKDLRLQDFIPTSPR